ncbi:UNVERIFIED_CONTAM: hypothetical protein Sradi_3461000 [Sesamum radiatum]|uniref:Uncharacterized protein n=1 Tax=Sesamum radiatum TaxID=300843 RepID=A0AAW2R7C1_SESRA
MQVYQQRSWTLTLGAKAKNLDFKFKASSVLPVCKLFRFSVQFKLHPYFLEIKSKPVSSFFLKSKSLKLKFLEILKKFQSRRAKNKGIVRSWRAHKNYLYGRRKTPWIWLWVLVFAMVGGFIIMQLSCYLGGGFLWKYSWKAINYAAPSGFLYQLSKAIIRHFQVIFDGICGWLGF